ncbi:hypothetical protein ACFX1W_000480 [Malus domestica]
MGRSRTYDYNHPDGHRVIHMEEHHMSLRYPSFHCHRQRSAVYGQRVGEVLRKIWHQAAHVHAPVFARQRAGRGVQQDHPQEIHLRQEGQVAKRAPQCSVGVLHHQETSNQRNSFLSSVWL